MLARSVRNPLFVGLGTGVVLIIGAASPVLAAAGPTPSPPANGSSTGTTATPTNSGTPTPTPTPTATPTPTPTPTKVPVLSIALLHTPRSGSPNTNYSMDVYVKAPAAPAQGVDLTVWSSRAKVTFDGNKQRTYHIGKLAGSKRPTITVAVPSTVTSGTVTVYAWIDADGVQEKSTRSSFTVKKPKASSSHSSGSGGSGGSSGSHTSPAPLGSLHSGTNNQAPSVATPNGTVLPGIGGQQNPGRTPSTAPLVQTAGNSQSMAGAAGPDELTFDKLASTQAAWLAALLVAFSLLLTQVRLGKADARAAAKAAKPKGAHRRTRRRRRGARAR